MVDLTHFFSPAQWSSNDDVLDNVMVSDQIPCTTTDTFYNIFRGGFGARMAGIGDMTWHPTRGVVLTRGASFLTRRRPPRPPTAVVTTGSQSTRTNGPWACARHLCKQPRPFGVLC